MFMGIVLEWGARQDLQRVSRELTRWSWALPLSGGLGWGHNIRLFLLKNSTFFLFLKRFIKLNNITDAFGMRN